MDKLKDATSKLTTAFCSRFSSQSYENALKFRNDTANCRSALTSPQEKAGYHASDQALKDFAERCDCRQILEGMDANTETLRTIGNSSCWGAVSTKTLNQAKSSVAILSDEWQKKCKAVVSSSMNSEMVSKQNQFTHLFGDVSGVCKAADDCKDLVAKYEAAAEDAIKMADDSCRGTIHEAIRNADVLYAQLKKTCRPAVLQSFALKIAALRHRLAQIPGQCFYGQDRVMNDRCELIRVTHVHSHKKAGCAEKDFYVTINEHWCAEEEDVAECKKYANIYVSIDKFMALICASKTLSLSYNTCVPPSIWRQCKSLPSTGDVPTENCEKW